MSTLSRGLWQTCALGLGAALSLSMAACGDDGGSSDPADAAGPDAVSLTELAIACDDTEADVYVTPTAGVTGFDRGAIARCARGQTALAAAVQARLDDHGWNGPAVTTDIEMLKVAFGTERSAPDATATTKSLTSALVLIPKERRGTGALPVVVAAHGTIGIGDHCTPSSNDLLDPIDTFRDASALYLGLASMGYIVIAPDYAGYNYGDGPTGYFTTGDEVRSVLDAPKAARTIFPAGTFSNKAVIIGHSQGGHTAIAAQPYAETYGLDGELAGVMGYAPMWISMRAWGASLASFTGINATNSPAIYLYATTYFYVNGLAADGSAGRLSPFDADKQSVVENFLLDNCRSEASGKIAASLGVDAKDFFDDAFVDAVSGCGLNPSGCTDPAAARWAARWATGRPALSATGAPVVMWGGGMDSFITPARMACGNDKITADLGASVGDVLTVCGDTGAGHADIVAREGEWTAAWIDNVASGGAAPAACPGLDVLGGGTAPACDALPPNVD